MSRLRWWAVVPFVTSLVIAAWEITRPGIPSAYDSGVYLNAAYQFVAGWWPYRDFAFVQPPGIVLLISPAAVVAHLFSGTAGVLAARATAALANAGAVALVSYIFRRRPGVALVSSLLVAVGPWAVSAADQVKLEPFLAFFVTAALAALDPDRPDDDAEVSTRRLAVAAVALGAGVSVKLWAVIPMAAIAWVLWWPRRDSWRGRLRRPLAIFFGTLIVVDGPFVLAAPVTTFVREVVLDQITRNTPGRIGTSVRLDFLAGFPHQPTAPVGDAFAVAFVMVVTASVAAVWRRGGTLGRVWSLTAWLAVVAVLTPSEFYPYYAYFVDLFVAPTVVMAVAPLLSTRVVRLCVAGLCVAGLATVTARVYGGQSPNAGAADAALIERIVPRGACVVYDLSILALLANRAQRPSPACPLVVDPYGMDMTTPRDVAAARWEGIFSRVDYAVFGPLRATNVPWTTALESWFLARFWLVSSRHGMVYVYEREH